jgi:hypothetical protein
MRWLLKIILFVALSSAIIQVRADIPAAFADIGHGARPIGMGGAYTAMASDPYGVLFNPACLPDARGWQISTLYTKQFGIIPYAMAAGTRDFGGRYALGAAFLSSGDEAFKENTLLAAFGMKLADSGSAFHRLSLGMAVKWRSASFGNNDGGGEKRIQGSAAGFGLDFGLRWKIASQWTAGMFIRDAWNRLSYNNKTLGTEYNESVPAALVLGTAYMPRSNLVFALDVDKALSRDVRDRFMTGMEWLLFKTIFFRTGFSQAFNGDPNRKVNVGIGLQHFRRSFGVRFDFAYQFHFLANTPRISTSVWF